MSADQQVGDQGWFGASTASRAAEWVGTDTAASFHQSHDQEYHSPVTQSENQPGSIAELHFEANGGVWKRAFNENSCA